MHYEMTEGEREHVYLIATRSFSMTLMALIPVCQRADNGESEGPKVPGLGRMR